MRTEEEKQGEMEVKGEQKGIGFGLGREDIRKSVKVGGRRMLGGGEKRQLKGETVDIGGERK